MASVIVLIENACFADNWRTLRIKSLKFVGGYIHLMDQLHPRFELLTSSGSGITDNRTIGQYFNEQIC